MSEPNDDRPHGVAHLEALDREECLALLATAHVGRLGLVVNDRPEILPINYALDGDIVVFRTADSSILTEASLREVAFEADEVDEASRTGWSVMVQGTVQEIGDAVDPVSQRLRRLTLITWAPGQRDRRFALSPRQITGRRLQVVPEEL